MDAPSREIPDIWVRTRRRGLFGLAVVAAAAVAAWAGRGTSRVVRPFEFEEDDEHVFGLANASASRLGNATVSGLRDDDTDVDGLCLDYCPNTTSANDAACRLCDLQKVVRFHNEYEDASGIPIGEGYYPYMYLVEMWKPTTAELNAFELGDEAVSRVRRVDWSGDDVGHAVGSRVTMIFETHGTRNVTVSMRVATTRGEELGFHVELAVTVRYVRHEIRSLSVDDRSRFLDALSAVYATGDDLGKSVYGDKFRSSHYLVRKHLLGGGGKECDHWHDDAGIVTHHIAFTLHSY